MTDRRRRSSSSSSSSSSPSPPPSEKLHKGGAGIAGVGKGVKGKAAQVHGTGEALRGHATAAVDKAMDSPDAARKNTRLAQKGEREMDTGRFSEDTEVKEGVKPAKRTGESQTGYDVGRGDASPVRHGQRDPTESGAGGFGSGPKDTEATGPMHGTDQAGQGGMA